MPILDTFNKLVDNVAIVTAWASTPLKNVLSCEPAKFTVTGISIVTLLTSVWSSCSAPAARDTLPPASIETLSIVNCNRLVVTLIFWSVAMFSLPKAVCNKLVVKLSRKPSWIATTH